MLSFTGTRSVRNNAAVGDGCITFVHHQRDVKSRLERRLVEGRKGASCVRRFKLRGRIIPKLGLSQVEAAQLVIENPFEFNLNAGWPGREWRVYCECGLLFLLVETDFCFLAASALGDRRLLKFDFDRVERD